MEPGRTSFAHDEWSLDKLTEAERQEVFEAFGPKPDMQLFGRELRRRLPIMLSGDHARLDGRVATPLREGLTSRLTTQWLEKPSWGAR